MRLNGWQNQATILTEANPRNGEPLKPGNWTVHSLNLQNPAKSPLARANLFFSFLTTFCVLGSAALSDKYGKPIPIGYFTDESQRDALIEALMMIGDQYVGAFPIGTKITPPPPPPAPKKRRGSVVWGVRAPGGGGGGGRPSLPGGGKRGPRSPALGGA